MQKVRGIERYVDRHTHTHIHIYIYIYIYINTEAINLLSRLWSFGLQGDLIG